MILALIDTKDRPARVRVRWSDEVEVPRLN
jgi:hypothetical protein